MEDALKLTVDDMTEEANSDDTVDVSDLMLD